jgi:hypothetical protein
LSLRIAPTRSACTSAICSAIEGVQYHPTAAFPIPVVRLNAVPPFCHFDPGSRRLALGRPLEPECKSKLKKRNGHSRQ